MPEGVPSWTVLQEGRPQWSWSWADPHPAVEGRSSGGPRGADPGASGRDQTLRYPWGNSRCSGGPAVNGLGSPEGGWASCLEEAGPCHLEVADKGPDAVSLCWPVVSPHRQPFGCEFLPEMPLFAGAECLANGASVATGVRPALGTAWSSGCSWGVMCSGVKGLPGG